MQCKCAPGGGKKIDYYGVWDFYKRGAVKKIETNNDTDAAVEVTETFDYDIYGNVVRTAQQLAAETENVVEYEYNAAGQLSKEIYLNDYIDDITLDAADKVGIGETKAVVSNESIVMQPGFEAAAGSSFSATAVSGSADIGLVVTYHYDIAGNLKNIGKGGDKNFFATYIYGKNGEMSQEKMFNDQIASTFSYNSSGLLTGITHNKVNGGASYYSQSLRYFPSEGGNNYRGLIGRMDFSYQHTLYATSSKPASHYFGFGYDKLGRLTSANNVIHNDFDLSVSYDANGNYLSMARGGNAANYSYQNGTNKVIGLTGPNASQYAYDQIGNVRSSSGNLVSFTYDPYINKPTVFNNEGTNYSYQYGGAGQRVLKSQNSSNKIKYIHGSSLYPKAEEQVISGTTHYRFSVRGETGMLAMQYDGAWYFMLKDHLGSPRAIVDEDLQVVAWFEWGATGELIAAGFDGINETEAPHLYTGHEVEDLNKGLYHFIARFYDADLGRFYGVDPAGQFSSPYAGMRNNPIMMVDPDGEFALIPLIGAALFWGVVEADKAQARGENWGWDFLSGAGKSIATSLVGSGVNSLVSNQIQSSFGIGTGFFSDFSGGFAGSLSTEIANSLLTGESISLNSLLINSTISGSIAGVEAGVWARSKNSSFWTGEIRNPEGIVSISDPPVSGDSKLKFHSKTSYIYDEQNTKSKEQYYVIKAGSFVKVKIKNKHFWFGSIFDLEDQSTYFYKKNWLNRILGGAVKTYSGQGYYSEQLFAGKSRTFSFTRFVEEPYTWKFMLRTHSDIANLSLRFYSTWIPSMDKKPQILYYPWSK